MADREQPERQQPDRANSTDTGTADQVAQGMEALTIAPAPPQPAPNPHVNPCHTNLHHFHGNVQFQQLATGSFRKVRSLADAIHGKVILMQRTSASGEPEVVVVKKMENFKVDGSRTQESNDRTAHLRRSGHMEDALNEIGVLNLLNSGQHTCPYILRFLGVFRDATHTWLTTENCGSGELFALVANQPHMLGPPARYVWQILRAVRFMHSLNIGHRDISLENVLIKDGDVRVMDFGQAAQICSEDPSRTVLRYFRPCGKNYYRAPEAYVPQRELQIPACPPNVSGTTCQVNAGGYLCEVAFPADAVAGQPCVAVPQGYALAPLDMFAVGVCIFVLHTHNPPWRMAIQSDQLFAYIHTRGVNALLVAWQKPMLSESALALLQNLLQANPALRCTAEDALRSEWFSTMGPGGGDGPGGPPAPPPPPPPPPPQGGAEYL